MHYFYIIIQIQGAKSAWGQKKYENLENMKNPYTHMTEKV